MKRYEKLTGIHWTIVIKEDMTIGLGVRIGPETHLRWWSGAVPVIARKGRLQETVPYQLGNVISHALTVRYEGIQDVTNPLDLWGFGYEPQNGNVGNWLVSQYIFTSFCATSSLSWTWYYLSVNFLLLDIFLYFPWSMTPCLRSSLDRLFWNSLARLTSFFGAQECIRICESNFFDPGSWTVDINWYI